MNDTQLAGGPTRLLVVEDDEPVAEGLCGNLELEGFSVQRVGTGEEGLLKLAEDLTDFELLVLDIMLPGIDGFEVCRRSTG